LVKHDSPEMASLERNFWGSCVFLYLQRQDEPQAPGVLRVL
jgi:hypothetical protein